MPLKMLPAVEDDLLALSHVQYTAFISALSVFKSIYPKGQLPPRSAARAVACLRNSFLNDPTSLLLKVVDIPDRRSEPAPATATPTSQPGAFASESIIEDPAGEKQIIVAIGHYHIYRTERPPEEWDRPYDVESDHDPLDGDATAAGNENGNAPNTGVPVGVNIEAVRDYIGSVHDIRRRRLGGKPHVHLHVLATLPEYQGRGAGSMLIRHSLELAQREGLDAVLEASPVGEPLYRKMGYQVLEKWDFDMRDYGYRAGLEDGRDREKETRLSSEQRDWIYSTALMVKKFDGAGGESTNA